MTHPHSIVNTAQRIADELTLAGADVLSGVKFTTLQSPVLTEVFLKFALSDDLAYGEFMRVGSVRDVMRLPLEHFTVSPDNVEALGLAKNVQLLLEVMGRYVHSTVVTGGTAVSQGMTVDVPEPESLDVGLDHMIKQLTMSGEELLIHVSQIRNQTPPENA